MQYNHTRTETGTVRSGRAGERCGNPSTDHGTTREITDRDEEA
jgi:hypothetical protein